MGRRSLTLWAALGAAALLAPQRARGDAGRDAAAPAFYRIDLPAGWKAAPELTAGDAGSDMTRRAWMDPGAGLFVLVQSVELQAGDAAALHQALRDAFAAPATVDGYLEEVRDDGMESKFTLSRGEMAAQVHTVSVNPGGDQLRAASVACFYPQGRAAAAEKRCAEIAASLEVKP